MNHRYLDESFTALSQARQVFILSFCFLHWKSSVGYELTRVQVYLSSECMQPKHFCLPYAFNECVCLSFIFDVRVCVSTSILTMLYCWLHVCFPQAAVRGQKGEKGDPAVLEPVSD